MSSSTDVKTATTATFLTALVFNGAVFVAQLAVFTLLKPYFKRIYEPRAINKKIHSLSVVLWPYQVLKADYRAVIKANGMDAYFFVRFLRMLFKMFLPIWIISWAVLLPLTAVNSRVGNNDGLDKLSFGNVEPSKELRYIGHILCVYLFTGWIFWNIKQEMRHFVITRQHYLIDSIHAKTVQANTILVTGIPTKYLNQAGLTAVYGALPGGVKKIWINRNLKDLPDVYERRMKAINKLEGAETKLLATAAKLNAKQAKSGGEQKGIDREKIPRPTHKLGFLGLIGEKVDSINWAREEIRKCTELLQTGSELVQSADDADERKAQAEADKRLGGWAEKQHHDARQEDDEEDEFGSKDQQDEHDPPRPAPTESHSPALSSPNTSPRPGFTDQVTHASQHAVGQISHTAQHASELSKQTAQQASALSRQAVNRAGQFTKEATHVASNLLSGKKGAKEYPPLNSAFITFHKQIAAHMGVQLLAHHEPYRMSGRYIELSPNDVIWGNLGLNPYETKVRLLISWSITAALIIFWTIPVGFIGIISNIYTVCSTLSWLGWICKLPSPVVGIISGILPPVLLAVLMMLLPIVLRRLAQFEGIPQKTGCEMSLMHRFFAFQVVHTFLVVTLSSGLTTTIKQLKDDPSSVASILATNLPKSSTFFLTYTLLQLAGTSGGFLQIVALIIYYVKLFILGSTPRSIWGLKYGKRGIGAWGTIWPGITVLVVIAFGYMIISPVINGVACVTFFLFYQMYKYLFLWVVDQSQTPDTGGLFFQKALQHMFVGLYVQQVCLIGLFFLSRDQNGKAATIAEGILMVILLVITIFYQMMINNSYGPLLNALPLTLADKMYVAPEVPLIDPSRKKGDDQDTEMQSPITRTSGGKGIEAEVLEEERDGFGFAHPAMQPARTVWIPQDNLGLAEEEERATREAGIDVVVGNGAVLNEKSSVEVSEEPGVPGQV